MGELDEAALRKQKVQYCAKSCAALPLSATHLPLKSLRLSCTLPRINSPPDQSRKLPLTSTTGLASSFVAHQKPQLKALCDAHGLETDGTKAVLIARLMEHGPWQPVNKAAATGPLTRRRRKAVVPALSRAADVAEIVLGRWLHCPKCGVLLHLPEADAVLAQARCAACRHLLVMEGRNAASNCCTLREHREQTERDVDALMEMGFGRDAAARALKTHFGCVNDAAGALLNPANSQGRG